MNISFTYLMFQLNKLHFNVHTSCIHKTLAFQKES